MNAPEKIDWEEIELPASVDVLIHYPASAKQREEGYVIAFAMQYNVFGEGKSIKDAIKDLLRHIIERCLGAAEKGIHPGNLAPDPYRIAFFIGESLTPTRNIKEMGANLSKELSQQFKITGGKKLSLNIRISDVRQKQDELQVNNVLELAEVAAAA